LANASSDDWGADAVEEENVDDDDEAARARG
jgi:hypothetical protein